MAVNSAGVGAAAARRSARSIAADYPGHGQPAGALKAAHGAQGARMVKATRDRHAIVKDRQVALQLAHIRSARAGVKHALAQSWVGSGARARSVP